MLSNTESFLNSPSRVEQWKSGVAHDVYGSHEQNARDEFLDIDA